MSFLSPFFLFAVAAVGLPLVIHLLNLKRPQKVSFSTLAFFDELQKTTIRKIKVKKYLLLLLRLLAVACLAIVLARPFLPPGVGGVGNSQAPALNAILIDNSISMARIGQGGPLLEQAKEIVASLEASAKENDRFIFQVTNGESGYPTIIGNNQLIRRMEEITEVPSGNYIKERVSSLVEMLEDSPYQNKRLFIITDGQRSQLSALQDLERLPETISSTIFKLADVEVQNTVLQNLQSSTNMIGAGLPVTLTIDVKNQSQVPISNQFVTVEFNGEVVGQYSVSLAADAVHTFPFTVTPNTTGSSTGKIIVEGDEFTADNVLFFTIEVPETRTVIWVSDSNPTADEVSYTELVLRASGENDAQFTYQKSTMAELEQLTLTNVDALIFDGIPEIPEFAFQNLLNFVQNGGGILFFPSEQGNIINYNRFLNQFNAGTFEGLVGEFASFSPIASVTEIQQDHPVFTGLFDAAEDEQIRVTRPEVYYYYKFRPSSAPGGFSILTMNSGDPVLREKRFGEGKLMVSAIGTGPGWSNFAVKPLFAPLYYRSLLYVASSDEGGFVNHTLGQPFEWIGDIDNSSVKIINGQDETVPESEIVVGGTRIEYPGKSWIPGWLTISDGEQEYLVATNLDEQESVFQSVAVGEKSNVTEQFTLVDTGVLESEDLRTEIAATGFGREIWTWFMIAGFLFLLLESLVSIFYKTETSTV